MTNTERTNGLVSPAQTDTNGHSDISASATSDTMPKSECDHRVVAWFTISFIESLIEQGYFVFCPKCGEKL